MEYAQFGPGLFVFLETFATIIVILVVSVVVVLLTIAEVLLTIAMVC